MSWDDDRMIDAKLFGCAKAAKIHATGGYRPDPVELSDPLEWNRGVIREFCSGCGSLFELCRSGAAAMGELGGFQLPDDLSDRYLVVDGCSCCDAVFTSVSLKRIKS
ncbi:uncharacterized protein Dvar_51550 [Desulfosarcina variabilis str. Montpellier]|uniref:hypothetical protein n=1 Tax=Desulfosarcina variabilis TaxID=2300 RepID=UPI003AFAAF3E